MIFSPSNRYIHQSSFFFQELGFHHRVGEGKYLVFQSHDKHKRKFQSLTRMHGHELDTIDILFTLFSSISKQCHFFHKKSECVFTSTIIFSRHIDELSDILVFFIGSGFIASFFFEQKCSILDFLGNIFNKLGRSLLASFHTDTIHQYTKFHQIVFGRIPDFNRRIGDITECFVQAHIVCDSILFHTINARFPDFSGRNIDDSFE